MKRLKGNITIEASIVVPVMLMVLLTLVTASLVLHDIYVLRTANSLAADAQVIAGEDAGTSDMRQTFIIKPVSEISSESGMFRNTYRTSIIGEGGLGFFGLSMSADEFRDYAVRKPKTYIRTIDFFDDASDMWTVTRDIKDGIGEKLGEVEEILSSE